jgi:hypothetical protein
MAMHEANDRRVNINASQLIFLNAARNNRLRHTEKIVVEIESQKLLWNRFAALYFAL